jgi:hypothetical protein
VAVDVVPTLTVLEVVVQAVVTRSWMLVMWLLAGRTIDVPGVVAMVPACVIVAV